MLQSSLLCVLLPLFPHARLAKLTRPQQSVEESGWSSVTCRLVHRDDFRSRSHRATLCRLTHEPGEQHTLASAVCAGKQACVRLLCSLRSHSKHKVHLLFFPLDSLSGVTSHFCFGNMLPCMISIKFTLCVCVCVCLSRESDVEWCLCGQL